MSSKDDSLFDWDKSPSPKGSRFSITSDELDVPECHYEKSHTPATPGSLMPILLGPLFLLIVAFSMLVSFGVAVVSVLLGGTLLKYKAEVALLQDGHHITSAFAQVVALGCGVVNGGGCVLALLVAWLLNNARRAWARVFFCLVVGVTAVASAFVTVVGLFFLPGHLGPDGLSMMQALKAGPLGFGIVAVGVGLLCLPLYLCLRGRMEPV
ncbi:hypothetical protein L226DRAFT_614827 [Lentinus tigrinus ALCF2SS1-7]|uniref:uncharacterized protein n=1 Tax=Lentinus tigrinus ALCF2SS1-7 TaxID=1328758 RepID=UPI00116612BC|nr:hypothetical protein L226DRAFT_614827 [Lentinus tigrinus ALCF2SS1-7]